jgi:serine/threonine-protein kinase RsbW
MDGSATQLRVTDRAAPAPAGVPVTEAFTGSDIADVRALVRAAGTVARVASDELDDLLLAVSEIATNAIRHGGATGWVTVEHVPTGLVVEISDNGGGLPDGLVVDRPAADAVGGRGLWLAYRMCPRLELVDSPHGLTVRLTASGGTT